MIVSGTQPAINCWLVKDWKHPANNRPLVLDTRNLSKTKISGSDLGVQKKSNRQPKFHQKFYQKSTKRPLKLIKLTKKIIKITVGFAVKIMSFSLNKKNITQVKAV